MGSNSNAPKHLFEKKISSKDIYNGRILNVIRDTVELEDGSQAFREVILHPGGACVVPLTADGNVIMVRQFRYPHGVETLEIPAGKLEYGEDPAECAIRELREEAGASCGRFDSLGRTFPTPAYDKEIIYMYLARDLEFSQGQDLDEGEFLDVVTIPLSEALDMVMRDELPDAKTQIALLKTARLLAEEKDA